jgi:hypothetical protein
VAYVPFMDTAITLLAAAGIAAVLLRAVLALFRALRGGVDSFLARDMADLRAQRGDLTGLAAAAEVRQAARRQRMFAFGAFAVWIGLLAVPQLTPWPRFLYVIYSLLWLVPHRASTPRHT